MNALELMTRLDGHVLGHKIRATVDGSVVVLARMEGDSWTLTEQGQELANIHSNQIAAEADVEVKVTRARKSKDTPTEPVAVELAEIESEL